MDLTFEEIRVLGCLIEKEANTPEHYPLTSNALTAACNQKSSRDPVVSFSTRQVDDTVMLLRQAGLARSNMGGRSSKHRHILDEALGLTVNQTIVLSVLMLRGPQSAGELRTRTDRSIGFDDLPDVEEVLRSLRDREDPLVEDLGRGAGQSQNRWIHLLGDAASKGQHAGDGQLSGSDGGWSTDPVLPSGASSSGASPSGQSEADSQSLANRVNDLERRLAVLEVALGMETDQPDSPSDDRLL